MGSCVCVCEREKEKAANMTDIHFGFMSDMLLVYVTIHVFFFFSSFSVVEDHNIIKTNTNSDIIHRERADALIV